jgi:hypothetical protein
LPLGNYQVIVGRKLTSLDQPNMIEAVAMSSKNLVIAGK